jgi:alpha-galactosidase
MLVALNKPVLIWSLLQGWSSWYGFTSNIDEVMLRKMGDGMISSGLKAAGYSHIWIDDGWAIARENKSGTCAASGPTGVDSCKPIVDPKLFPSGMRNLSDYLHGKDLKFGIYTSKGPLTCLGGQKTQPNRPGSCGYEQVDANTYVRDWNVDQVKDDGCGGCPQHEPFAAMRDALNKTGKAIWYAIHSSIKGVGNPNATVANMWRTGGDLYASSYDMWTNRLDLATSDVQAALTGPGAFPNPDFLEVGYSPRNPKGRSSVMSALAQRSMFTMWAALPGPLILSADLRPGAPCGGIDAAALETLTNAEVIAINQDARAAPMRPIYKKDGVEVWRKPLQNSKVEAVILFNRNHSSSDMASPPTPHPTPKPEAFTARNITVTWEQLGYSKDQLVLVRDLWRKTEANATGSFVATVAPQEASIYTFTRH